MVFKKTVETLDKGAHTLDRKFYLNSNILKKEYENIIYGKKEWDIYDDVDNSLYKNLGLYKCDIEELKKIDINKCTIILE